MNSTELNNPVKNNFHFQTNDQTRQLSKKKRLTKLVHALALAALTILSFGYFHPKPSIRQLFTEAWTGKTVINISSDSIELPSALPKAKKNKELTFENIEEETEKLKIQCIKLPSDRFKDISCPKETVVKCNNNAIHGNWVRMPDENTYIATQAPTESTAGLIWQIAHQNQGFVVDLTTPKDGIDPYYPTQGKQDYSGAAVELKQTRKIANNLILYTYNVTADKETREVQRLHFSGWKDFNGTSKENLNKLVDNITAKMDEGKTPIIHCRAGVGRTGTLISTITLKNLIKQGVATSENIDEKMKEVIMTGRKCRGPLFVQTEEQFEVIKQAVTI